MISFIKGNLKKGYRQALEETRNKFLSDEAMIKLLKLELSDEQAAGIAEVRMGRIQKMRKEITKVNSQQ